MCPTPNQWLAATAPSRHLEHLKCQLQSARLWGRRLAPSTARKCRRAPLRLAVGKGLASLCLSFPLCARNGRSGAVGSHTLRSADPEHILWRTPDSLWTSKVLICQQ